MPHLTLEYSSNLVESPVQDSVLLKLNQLLPEIGPFNLADIKSRALRHESYCVAGGGSQLAFIHLSLAILPGRSTETKREISARLLEFLRSNFSASIEKLSCSCTVEIRELDKGSYSKLPGRVI